MPDYNKPLPVVDEDSRPFWEGAKRHEVQLQKCGDCGKFRFYPRYLRPHCFSDNTKWTKVSGRGKIYSFTVSNRAGASGFRPEVPYSIAIIELEEGVRMMSNMVECRNEDLSIDMPVEVVFDDVTPEITLLKFRPRHS